VASWLVAPPGDTQRDRRLSSGAKGQAALAAGIVRQVTARQPVSHVLVGYLHEVRHSRLSPPTSPRTQRIPTCPASWARADVRRG